MAVDWVAENLYWTETDRSGTKPKGKVMVSKQDGRYRRSIVDGGKMFKMQDEIISSFVLLLAINVN